MNLLELIFVLFWFRLGLARAMDLIMDLLKLIMNVRARCSLRLSRFLRLIVTVLPLMLFLHGLKSSQVNLLIL